MQSLYSSLLQQQPDAQLQHTATHIITLQHTAAHFNALQHTATHVRGRVHKMPVGTRIVGVCCIVCCSVLHRIVGVCCIVCCSVLHSFAADMCVAAHTP